MIFFMIESEVDITSRASPIKIKKRDIILRTA